MNPSNRHEREHQIAQDKLQRDPDLMRKYRQVWTLIEQGIGTREIARRMNLSHNSIKSWRKHLHQYPDILELVMSYHENN